MLITKQWGKIRLSENKDTGPQAIKVCVYIRSQLGLADLTLMHIHEKQVCTVQERYQVNLKEHPLKYFWLLLILSSFIHPVPENHFKWYFPPPAQIDFKIPSLSFFCSGRSVTSPRSL